LNIRPRPGLVPKPRADAQWLSGRLAAPGAACRALLPAMRSAMRGAGASQLANLPMKEAMGSDEQ
jgi:hypothetical protein